MLIVMDLKLTGRSAILKRRIDKLQREIEAFAALPLAGLSEEPDGRVQELTQLRHELAVEGKTKRVVILATEHGCQQNGNGNNGALAERLSLLIDRFAVSLLMEEWSETKAPSFASTLVSSSVSYMNVGTPSEEQFHTYRFPINHPSYMGTLDDCDECPSMSEYGPLDRQENREQRMLQNIRTAMEPHPVGLFLVGLGHLHSMSNKLVAAGFTVTAFEWLGRTLPS
jgi:hypothetical protein